MPSSDPARSAEIPGDREAGAVSVGALKHGPAGGGESENGDFARVEGEKNPASSAGSLSCQNRKVYRLNPASIYHAFAVLRRINPRPSSAKPIRPNMAGSGTTPVLMLVSVCPTPEWVIFNTCCRVNGVELVSPYDSCF